jgi:hypothetical protein
VTRICKSIPKMLLLLAGFIIISHLIIPHDHHTSFQKNSTRDSCPLSDEKTGHHPLFPAHCHAFNDMAADKFSPVAIPQLKLNGIMTIIWFPDYVIPGIQVSHTILPASDKPFYQIFVPDSFPLRAPPSVS